MDNLKKVDQFIEKHVSWKDSLHLLRNIFLYFKLEETIKWGRPVYCLENKNIAGIGAFKSHFGIWFFQGALLSDPLNILVNAQDGKTKAMRHLKFNSYAEIKPDILKKYIKEAIDNQKQGKEIIPATNKSIGIPDELEKAFQKDHELKSGFNRFSQAKKREFTEYISQAKREETKLKRLDKIIPLIKSGKGLNDRYR